MLISNPTNEQWEQLSTNCFATPEDMEYINAFPYNNIRPERGQLLPFLQRISSGITTWLIEEEGQIVGFLNFGNVIPWQPHAFGMVIGRNFANKGYAKKALREFIAEKNTSNLQSIHGYCHRDNIGMIRVMQSLGFIQEMDYRDPEDANAIKFTLVLQTLGCRIPAKGLTCN